MYSWNWNIVWQYKEVFLEGALVTCMLALLTVLFGTLLGMAVALMKGSPNVVFSSIARCYVGLFRALPILVVLIWIYYVVPSITSWRMSAITAAVIALSMHLAAFVCETIRASVESIPHSQFESGLAIGMSRMQTMRIVILPQAVRNMVPNLLGLYIAEIKNTSLTSVIAVNELLHRTNIVISETYRPLELYTTLALSYLVIILPFVFLSRCVERRFSKGISSSSLRHYGTGYQHS